MPTSPSARIRRALPDGFTALLFCSTAALFAVVSPLLSHTLALALLVVPHVIFAVRYDRAWLLPRVPRGVWLAALCGTGLMVLLRLAHHHGHLGADAAATGELALLVGMIVPALPLVLPRAGVAGGVLTGALAALSLATLAAPVDARMLAEAVHWLVPMGLLVLRMPPGRRGGLVSAGLFFFVAVPLLIAGGVPASLAERAGASWPDDCPVALGPLEAHLPRVFPSALHEHVRAPDFFRARVYLEYLHCAVVLAIFPALPRSAEAPPPLRLSALAGLVASLMGAAAVLLYAAPVETAGALEAAGTLQGWLELPLIIAALGSSAAAARARSTPPPAPRSG